MLVVLGPVIAVVYCRAAQRDERNGFPLTAAMEWRHAAELLGFLPGFCDYCWREWERIMNLPRDFARPITELAGPTLPGRLTILPTTCRWGRKKHSSVTLARAA